ncbi:MAG: C40 family peptidase [Lachnospiraceae bacterium]|nr:C40 family peptidase [Lachnospiraceae bacterium]
MMKKGIARFTAFCMAAGLTIGGTGIVSMADGVDMTLVGIGSSTQAAASGEEAKTEDQDETASEETEAAEVSDTAYEEPVAETEAALDTSMVDTMGIAQCDAYINVRATGDTEGEVLGKLYNNSAVYILGVDEHGWYKVRSGNVEGYVASQYIVTGAEAEALATEVGYHVAEVGAEVLNVRAAASEDAEIVTTVTNTQEVEVVEDCGEWLKVAVDSDCYGYVSADYVNTEMQYKVAESVEEEQARLDAEYQEYLDQQAAAEAEYQAYLDQQNAEYQAYLDAQAAAQAEADAAYQAQLDAQAAADAAVQSTYDAQAEAEAAYQAYLDAQAAADAATQQADEQAVLDTAQQAQDQYQAYLDAQAAADAQAQAEADALAQAQQAADAAQQAQDEADATPDYTDYDYTDDASDDVYVDDTASDDGSYDDGSYDDGSSSSGYTLGQQIVDFACQFVGNPYVWGGTSLTNGADCSGFTQSVMANFGISIPRTAAEQSYSGTPVSLSEIQPGDLLFYEGSGGIGHVTIYMGNGQVVHASTESTGIIISSYSYRTPCSARRYW